MGRIHLLTATMVCWAVVSCSNEKKAETTPPTVEQSPDIVKVDMDSTGTKKMNLQFEYQMSGIPFDLNGKPVSIAGITFVPASQWKDLGPSGMRVADYTYAPLEPDKDSSTLAVFYFGQEQGGAINANLDRWLGQMSLPDGRNPRDAAIQYTMLVDSMTVHVLSVLGTYNASVGGMMAGQATPKENYRLIGVVVEAPEGNVFFKLTGPEYTARIMTEAYITMVKQIKKS